MSQATKGPRSGRYLCAALFAALALGAFAGPAQAAFDDPLWVFYASEEKEPKLKPSEGSKPYPAPGTGFEGACGIGVDSGGRLFVSDYYHHNIDIFKPIGPQAPDTPTSFVTQLSNVDPLDGPCGVGIDNTGGLFVNDYHRNVVKYTPSLFPPAASTTYGAGTVIDSDDPTGVAVDPLGEAVYVNDRTYVAAYTLAGAPVLHEGSPLKLGLGTIGDGYGLAVSLYPGTAGRVYVPDATTDTVKVYNPGLPDKVNPVATITGPPGGFSSLRDSAVAVDRVSGKIYVADNLQPLDTEHPEAAIYVFGSAGAYLGRLKYNVIDALPPGLAVDNTESPDTKGRVYVTSGDTAEASVFAYPPGAETAVGLPAPDGEDGFSGGAGEIGTAAPPLATQRAGSSGVEGLAAPQAVAAASAERTTLRRATKRRRKAARKGRGERETKARVRRGSR